MTRNLQLITINLLQDKGKMIMLYEENRSADVAAEEYANKVLNRIKNFLIANKISQKGFAERCGLSPSAISKLLAGKSVLSLKMIYKVCKALEVEPEMMLSDDENTLDSLDKLHSRLHKIPPKDRELYRDSLLFDPTRPAFRGITNDINNSDDYYYFYCKPTISDEKKEFLEGKLRIVPATDSDKATTYCSATLELKTGKVNRDTAKEIVKIYNGEMIISLPMRTCYILLTSAKYAEVNLISFSHMFLNDEKLQCRIAAVLTTSCGANRRPTLEKAIISRVPLKEHLGELEGQLFMNTSKLSVRKDILDTLGDEEFKNKYKDFLGYQDGDEDIKGNYDKVQSSKENSLLTSYYEIDEGQIKSSPRLTAVEKLELINKLRALSDNPRYVKVSSRADELLFSYIQSLQLKDLEQ